MNPRRLDETSRSWRLPLVLAIAVMALAACGKKGPLYLPDKAEVRHGAVVQGVPASLPPRG